MSNPKASASDLESEALEIPAEQLTRLGIAAVPMMRYEWREYRYTNASDAIAAATRAVAK